MATTINRDLGAVLTYAPGAVPTSYAATTTAFSTAGAENVDIWVKMTTDPSSNFTSFGIKLQASYDASSGSWVDLALVDATTAAETNEQIPTVSANTTTWKLYATTNARMMKYLQIVIKGNGGSVQPADAVIAYVQAW